MKKLLCLIMASVLAAGLMGCGGSGKTPETADPISVVEESEIQSYIEESEEESRRIEEEERRKAEEEAAKASRVVVVDTSLVPSLNIRKEPSVNAELIGKLSADKQAKFIEEKDGWIKISIDNIEGYVSADYVKVIQATPTPKAE